MLIVVSFKSKKCLREFKSVDCDKQKKFNSFCGATLSLSKTDQRITLNGFSRSSNKPEF